MAVKKHAGSFAEGAIVGYTSYHGKEMYAYKLVQQVWIEAVGLCRWIAQSGKVLLPENKFVPDSDGEAFYVFTDQEIKDGYPEIWTKDPEYAKGDLLEAKSAAGKRVVLLYISNSYIERLTPLDDGLADRGWGSLAHYGGELTDFKILKTSIGDDRFSTI